MIGAVERVYTRCHVHREDFVYNGKPFRSIIYQSRPVNGKNPTATTFAFAENPAVLVEKWDTADFTGLEVSDFNITLRSDPIR
jgi:hypothetical protein